METLFGTDYENQRGGVAGLEPRRKGIPEGIPRGKRISYTETLAEWLDKCYDTVKSQITEPPLGSRIKVKRS